MQASTRKHTHTNSPRELGDLMTLKEIRYCEFKRRKHIKHLSLSSFSEIRRSDENITKSKNENVSFPFTSELSWLRTLTHQMSSPEPKHHKHQSFGGCHQTTLLVT